MPQSQRHRYRLITGHLTDDLLSDVHPDMIRITVLRDPVERIVSYYWHYRRIGRISAQTSLVDFARAHFRDYGPWTLERMHHVGTVDRLQEFCRMLADRYHLQPFGDRRDNVNPNRPDVADLRPRQRVELERILAHDIAVYRRFVD